MDLSKLNVRFECRRRIVGQDEEACNGQEEGFDCKVEKTMGEQQEKVVDSIEQEEGCIEEEKSLRETHWVSNTNTVRLVVNKVASGELPFQFLWFRFFKVKSGWSSLRLTRASVICIACVGAVSAASCVLISLIEFHFRRLRKKRSALGLKKTLCRAERSLNLKNKP